MAVDANVVVAADVSVEVSDDVRVVVTETDCVVVALVDCVEDIVLVRDVVPVLLGVVDRVDESVVEAVLES